jgi:hypothetical protein
MSGQIARFRRRDGVVTDTMSTCFAALGVWQSVCYSTRASTVE